MAGSVPSFLVKFIITIVASFFFVSDYDAITSFLARQLPQKARDMLFKVKEKGVDVIFKFGRAYAILLSITFVELLIGFSPVSYTHLARPTSSRSSSTNATPRA